MEPDAEIRRRFVAERRNLLIVSFVLFFFQQAGLTIEKVNVFGNEARIADPSWVPFTLWLLWTYFAMRCYQYFGDIEDKGFQAAYWRKLGPLTIGRAQERFIQRMSRRMNIRE
jgi:hypothetical protein